jgi:FkbM family methyltransferase
VRTLRRWLARARLRRIERRLAAPRLIAAFAQDHPAARFAEIGANDGAQHDHLRPYLRAGSWTGVMVEPVPYVYERLAANYGAIEGIRLINAAVGAADGTQPFFHLREPTAAERDGLPDWYDGVGSFLRETVLSHAPQIPNVAQRIVEREVEVLSFESLLARVGLSELDLLVIDAEGFDADILCAIDLDVHRPRLIVYEHFHLGPAKRVAARRHAEAAGYLLLEEGFDTFCLRADLDGADSALARAWARARPAVPGVAKSDEQPALALADTSVGLPAGAEEQLRDDHPRLVELRRAYAALDLPVTAASRWSPERVRAFLDLRWFRGETLITWHYREDPAATDRRYRAIHDGVRRDDLLGLLDRLEEDGLFGCWTFDVGAGRRVSRDLLESAAELNFLERRWQLTQRPRLRVLDIGAGYGRLAHRATSALGNLDDWCCVDAVPESTFLSEYYLGFRAAAPPARVVALPEIEAALRPGAFDLAVNVHSFSEMPLAAIEWWVALLERLGVPALFVVPNEPEELLSLEADGSRRDFGALIERTGYALEARDPMIGDAAIAAEAAMRDHHHLFVRR